MMDLTPCLRRWGAPEVTSRGESKSKFAERDQRTSLKRYGCLDVVGKEMEYEPFDLVSVCAM